MRQAVLAAPGAIEYRDVPEPKAGPGQALLRIRHIGICGSDVHAYHGRHPFMIYPRVQGHEFSGTIEAVGEGVSGFDIALDCAGSAATISAAVEGVNKGGTIVVVAVFQEKPPVDLTAVGDRELNLVGTLMYRLEDYEEAARRMGAGEIVTEPLESKHFPFEQWPAAYEYIDREGPNVMKVFIDL